MHKMLHSFACKAVKVAWNELSKDPQFGEMFGGLPPKEQMDLAIKMANLQRGVLAVLHYILPLVIAILALLLRVKH